MPFPVRRVIPLLLVLAAAVPGADGAVPSDEVPLVIAVDASRSLRAADLGAVDRTLSDVLGTLPPGTEAGLLAFADEPRWIRPLGTPVSEVLSALSEIRPEGRFTLLDDALFMAAQELDHGGVVVVATDGRDENSATTVEDVARRCADHGVRILALGTGDPVQERSLRRLALLTNGAYLGRVGAVDVVAVAQAVADAREAVAAEEAAAAAAAAPAPVEARPPTPREATPPPAPPAPGPRPWWRHPLLYFGAAALALLLLVLAWRSRSPRPRYCSVCGREIPRGEAECPHCQAEALQARLRDRVALTPNSTAEITVDSAFFEEPEGEDFLEKTRVLTEHSVLLMRKPGEPQRSFMLRTEAAFAVGREPENNTLSVSDPALSAFHFKIVPEDGAFYLVDLDSTNGTYLNRRRVRARQLQNGDLIHAGQVEFEFRSFHEQVL